jgi:hypothetical protein
MQFAVECCRQNFVGNEGAVAAKPGADLDWSRFLALVRFHRVQGLVWGALDDGELAPDDILDELSSDARAIAATNLRAAAESRDILDDFEAAGVPVLFVKGLTAAAVAYRQPLLKMSWDIDLLVAPANAATAGGRLARRGYRQLIPPPPADLERWHGRRKESVWAREGGLHVELHSRLADNPRLIPSITVDSPSETIDVAPGIRLPTLAREELFAYLCVHGASSAWFRLKWISDLAGLLHAQSGETIERLYQQSQALGADRAAGQALLLADRLYGSLSETGLREKLAADRATRWLAETAFAQLTGRPREPTSVRFGTWRIHLTQLALKRGLRFKLSEFTRQTRDASASRGGRLR